MFKKMTIAALVLALAAGATLALAEHHEGDGHHSSHAIHSEHVMHGAHDGVHLPSDATLKEWGVDDATIAELKDLHAKYDDQGIDLKADIEKANKALMRLHDKDDVTVKEMHAAIDKVYGAKADLMKLHATAALEARDLMGPETFAKIKDLHGEH